MNEVIQALLDRRTIRNFKHKQIKEEDLKLILKCGKYAPSSMNEQPWHFTVVQDKELLEKYNHAVKSIMKHDDDPDVVRKAEDLKYDIFYHAPTVIFISGDITKKSAPTDCANAAENICLAAYALKLGSCYNGSFKSAYETEKREDLISALKLPENYQPMFAVAIGYANIEKPIEPTRLDKINYIM